MEARKPIRTKRLPPRQKLHQETPTGQSPAEVLAIAVVKDWQIIETAFEQAVGTDYRGLMERLRRATDQYQSAGQVRS